MKHTYLFCLFIVTTSLKAQNSSTVLPNASNLIGNSSGNILNVQNSGTGTAGNFSSTGGNGVVSTTNSATGKGIAGYATNNIFTPGVQTVGVYGSNTSSYGYGVYGINTGASIGVFGKCDNGIGVYGQSVNGSGVEAYSSNFVGLMASSNTGIAGKFTSTSGDGVVSTTNSASGKGIAGFATNNTFTPGVQTVGVYGSNTSNYGYGVVGINTGTSIGVFGKCDAGIGVYGQSVSGSGIEAYSSNYVGIFAGTNSGTAGKFNSESGYSIITVKGNVGIGVLAPNDLLDVNGRVRIRHNANTAGIWMSNSLNSTNGADGAFYGMKTDTEAGIYIGNNWRFWVNNAGNVTVGGTVTASCGVLVCSDLRYKRNITSLNNSLDNILKISGVRYNFKKDEFPERNFSDKNQIGFIAQEIEKIFPEMVFTDEKGFKSVDYARLTPVLVEAMKEQQKMIDDLRLTNDDLKKNNQKLESRLDKIEAMILK